MEDARRGRLLIVAGLVTCAIAALPAAFRLVEAPTLAALAWLVPLAAFVAGFVVAVRNALPLARRRVALVTQSVAALAFAAFAPGGMTAVLTAVVAGEAPFLVGPRVGLALVAAQTATLGLLFASRLGVREGLVASGGYLGFQIFALGAGYLAEREALARAELARANAELLATRELFADATRAAERLRIARELHDAIGHHLTALGLQLEVAKNTEGPTRDEAIARSHEVAKQLLAEVRTVVRSMREEEPLDLARALERLAAGIARPKVHIAIEPSLRVGEPALCHAIFRFVQEAITNAARHADAQHLHVAITEASESVRVVASDDGRGCADLREGSGLAGLRERVEHLGGTFEIEAARGRGLELRATLPLGGGAS